MNVTTIEQSKRLLELGLKAETADLFYDIYINPITNEEEGQSLDFVSNWQDAWGDRNKSDLFDERAIPAWSLGALLELMPPYLFEWERGIDLNIYRNLNGKGWHCSYMPNNINDMQKDKFRQITNGDTTLEAAYNMVVWLLENGYIKTACEKGE